MTDKNILTWPAQSFLQAGNPDYIEPEDGEEDEGPTINYSECYSSERREDVTWSPDEIEAGDVPYIRDDLPAAGPWHPYPKEKPDGVADYLIDRADRGVCLEWCTAGLLWDAYRVTRWAEIKTSKGGKRE